jgi:hypothetical protein
MALGTAFLTVGCFSTQVAVHPWLAPQDALALPAIVGTWVERGDDPSTLRITPLETGADATQDESADHDGPVYELTVIRKDRPVKGALALTLGHLDGTLYWDLTPLPLDGTADLWNAHLLGLHSLARLTLEGDRLEVAPLDPDWIQQALGDGRLDADHLTVDDVPVLTGQTADLQHLVQDHANDDGAFARPAVFARRGTTSALE